MLAKLPRLSVVIPSHSRADLLAICLRSLSLHAPRSTEIIVVDDGSVAKCVSNIALTFEGVRVIRHEKAQGFCIAANRGIAESTGEIVELLNDDARVEAGWAEHALQLFNDPKIGSVAPLVLIEEQGESPRIDSAGDDYDLGGFAKKNGHRERLTPDFLLPKVVFGASGSSAFYRRNLLTSLGGLPSHFGSYFEDVDLSWRIKNAGFSTLFEPKSVVWHRVGSSHRKQRRLSEQQSRNEERVFWRNVPNLFRALPRHAAVLLGKSALRLRDGSFWPFFFGRLRAISEMKDHLKHRRIFNNRAH